MERKQTNLCVSVDVTKKQDLLDVVKAVSDVVALVKVSKKGDCRLKEGKYAQLLDLPAFRLTSTS